ncbi:MAG: hypothetical protein IJF98_00885 [Firmicutes bacterium]|nr:hypothetical protein [Bacillota bacterium]
MDNQNLKLRFHLVKRAVITFMPYPGSTISVDVSDDGQIVVNDNGICKTYPEIDINEEILHSALEGIFFENLPENKDNGQEDISWKIEFYNRRHLDHIAYGSEKTSPLLWDNLLWTLYSIEKRIDADLGTKYLRSYCETQKEENGKPAVTSDEMRSVYYHIMNCLLVRILEDNTGREKNIMISPLSLLYIISILMEAADGVTRDEIAVLFDKKYNEIKEVLSALIQDSNRPQSQLRIANALYADDELFNGISNTYLQTIADKYNTDLISSTFGNISEIVNEWVDRKTRGMLKRMLGDGEQLNSIAVLNALVFEAKWLKPYEEEDIESDVFHNEDGTESTVPMSFR